MSINSNIDASDNDNEQFEIADKDDNDLNMIATGVDTFVQPEHIPTGKVIISLSKENESKDVSNTSYDADATNDVESTNDATLNLQDVITNPSNNWINSWWKSASNTVTNLKSSVSDSISIVIHTVDSKLGAPDPSELAFQMQKIKKLKADANNREEQGLPAIDQEDCKLQKSNPTIGSPLYVEKFTNFISKPEISKIFNTGIDALENVGRITIETIKERQLKGVTSKLLRSGKSSDNANNVSHTLSELASRNNDVSKMDGLNPQISKVEANALEKLISTSKLSEEKLKLICIKDSSIDRMVSNIKSDLEIGDDRVTFNGTFFDFINAFNDKAKSLPIDKHSIKLTLNTINDNVQELNDADTFTVKATVDCCEESVQMLEDAVISLLCELIGLKEINHAFALSLKSLTSFLVDGLSICTQEYATIIKEMWMDDDQSELSDTISSLFFKESDHATKILDAYQYLQNHIIYNIIIKHADTNA